MQVITNLFDRVFRYASNLSETAMVLMGALVCVGVIARYVINEPLHWGLEVSCWLYVFMVFVGMAELMKNGQHIKIDIFYARFSGKIQGILDILIFIISLFWSVLMSWQAWRVTLNAYKYDLTTSSLLRFPLAIAYSFLAVGLTLLALSIIVTFVKKYCIENNESSSGQETKAGESTTLT
jgi:TRAP-type C4-dicarboxylate transport system permease small subunit